MVELEEISSDEQQHQQQQHQWRHEDEDEYVSSGPASGGAHSAASSGGAAASPLPDAGSMPAGFRELLQLASHIKSAQPEVREKRLQWERLAFHQQNTLLFQAQDADVRYDLAEQLDLTRPLRPQPGPEAAAAGGQEAAGAGAASAAADSTATAAAVPSHSDSPVPAAAHPSHFDDVRLPLALHFKGLSGALYAQGAFADASLGYQRAVGLFQWARKYDTKDGDAIEWNDVMRATEEESISEPDTHPGASNADLRAAAASAQPFRLRLAPLTPSQRLQALQFVFTCLVNIAACEEQLGQWGHVVAVCEAALGMDVPSDSSSSSSASVSVSVPASSSSFNPTALTVKALYRCAQAQIRLDELDAAVRLLSRARELAPGDARVARELARVREEVRKQAVRDKRAFGGMFERGGEIFSEGAGGGGVRSAFDTEQSVGSAATSHSTSAAAATSSSSSSSSCSSFPTGPAADRTRAFLTDYLAGVRELKQRDEHETTSGHGPGRPSRPASAARAPSAASVAALYADAQNQFGLDLSDPLVQEELRRLQGAHRSGKFNPGQGGVDGDDEDKDVDEEEKEQRAQQPQKSSSHKQRAAAVTAAGALPGDLTFDTASSSNWLGPLIFVALLAVAMRWMTIL